MDGKTEIRDSVLKRAGTKDIWRIAKECAGGGAAIVVITFICFKLDFPARTPTLLYMTVIVLLSLRGSFVSSFLVSLFSLLCLVYFFTAPVYSFVISDPPQIAATIAYITISAVITHLVSKVRQLMQEKLERSETYLAEAQHLSHTGSFGWNVSSGQILWSEETFRIYEYDRTIQPSMNLVLERVHPDDLSAVKSIIEEAAKNGRDFDFQHRLQMPGGLIKHVHVVAHAAGKRPGSVEFIGAVMDVTERTRAEEALDLAQSKLALATRLTAMGELTASIAHEVNQPLAAVVTNANAGLRWLDRPQPDLVEVREALQRIVRDGTRGSEIIARIRAMLKREQPLRRKLDLNDIVRETLALMRTNLQTVSVQTVFAPALPLVSADQVQLQQVLLNLILNAIDAMRTITDRPRVLRITTEVDEHSSVLVRVGDTGIGFEPKNSEDIFETFYTTKPDGFGMGLSICRSIIEKHGGRLWAASNKGPGATFMFTLPIEAPQ